MQVGREGLRRGHERKRKPGDCLYRCFAGGLPVPAPQKNVCVSAREARQQQREVIYEMLQEAICKMRRRKGCIAVGAQGPACGRERETSAARVRWNGMVWQDAMEEWEIQPTRPAAHELSQMVELAVTAARRRGRGALAQSQSDEEAAEMPLQQSVTVAAPTSKLALSAEEEAAADETKWSRCDDHGGGEGDWHDRNHRRPGRVGEQASGESEETRSRTRRKVWTEEKCGQNRKSRVGDDKGRDTRSYAGPMRGNKRSEWGVRGNKKEARRGRQQCYNKTQNQKYGQDGLRVRDDKGRGGGNPLREMRAQTGENRAPEDGPEGKKDGVIKTGQNRRADTRRRRSYAGDERGNSRSEMKMKDRTGGNRVSKERKDDEQSNNRRKCGQNKPESRKQNKRRREPRQRKKKQHKKQRDARGQARGCIAAGMRARRRRDAIRCGGGGGGGGGGRRQHVSPVRHTARKPTASPTHHPKEPLKQEENNQHVEAS
ncbi:hypothetical protein C8R43DRAFT_958096 [Mycena crocata]|nr:hypothetical protein C8R43DRAFT_958096 [Mycena crocata]